jgi:N6-adenosine-specific RNA methylase IME4
MADPPWDIHMELPYGTMSDDEMRRLPIPSLQVILTNCFNAALIKTRQIIATKRRLKCNIILG